MVESAPNFTGLIVRRQRIMGLWFGLLILVFGIIIGAGGTFLYLRDRLVTPPPPVDRIRGMVREMHDKLDLTDQQEKQIHTLFETRFKEMGEFFKTIGEKQKQEWELTLSGMKSILTEEQFANWKKEMDERQRRWGRERGPRQGGPEGQRGQGGPDRPDGRRDKPGQNDRMQQGPPPGGPKPGGPMPDQPTPPPPGAPNPDQAPTSTEPAPSSTPPTTPEEPKPL